MNIKTKDGVVFKAFNKPFMRLIKALDDIGDLFNVPMTITSGNDGKHMETSLHYKDLAWDLRTRDLTKDKVIRLVEELKMRLGGGFQIILEKDHVHVEFQS